MASNDLVFEGAPLLTGDLVFGDDGSSPVSDAVISGAITLAKPTLSGTVVLGIRVAGSVTLTKPTLHGEVVYFTDTQRPLVGRTAVRFQDAAPLQAGAQSRWQQGAPLPAGWTARHQDALPLSAAVTSTWRDATRRQNATASRFQDGLRKGAGLDARFQDGLRLGAGGSLRFQDGLPLGQRLDARFQDGLRIWRANASRFQQALRLQRGLTENEGYGLFIEVGRTTRFQDAVLPPHGKRVPPVIPPTDPCYTPSGQLVFSLPWSSDTNLVFTCDAHGTDPEPPATVVVPIRRIYRVINTASLRRVDGNIAIPTRSMTLSIDVESWTWGFTASVPGLAALAALEPAVDGGPVEVEALINGVAYRALVEGISRERRFARADLSISGRGKAAVLDAPYSPAMSFGNPDDPRLAQQLANDVLTLNGTSIGWAVDWHPEDWTVGAGAFSHQGSYISALNAIASAAGGYLQPHRTAQSLSVLLRYPVAPWDWGTVTPDYELPADVVETESIQWVEKPRYNRVYVSGAQQGVLGRVTRAGTAGDLVAPAVIDPLIANALAARQRALPVLADIGRQAIVGLRLPVLSETGIIPPGKFVRYVDGGITRTGLVRSTAAAIERTEDEKLVIWQTIGVETHVAV